MLDGYFSKRYNLRPKSRGFIYEHVPESARSGLYQILDNYFQDRSLNANKLYMNISHALHLDPKKTHGKIVDLPSDARKDFGKLIMECEWWQFYDICEVIPRSFAPYYEYLVKDFCEKVNILFKAEKLEFQMTDDGRVEQAESSFIDATIKKARYLLKEPEFEETNEYFEKAIKAINLQINPDGERCIKDALRAIELTVRRINSTGNNESSFSDVIHDMNTREIISRPAEQVIRDIYAFADEQYGLDEAELVLAISAAIIIYLVDKDCQSKRVSGTNEQHIFIDCPQTIQSKNLLKVAI